MKQFDARHMIVSRGRVYNKHTGRWEGDAVDFDMEETPAESGEVPFVEDLDKPALVKIARDAQLPGYSSMNKDELVEALFALGRVQFREEDE